MRIEKNLQKARVSKKDQKYLENVRAFIKSTIEDPGFFEMTSEEQHKAALSAIRKEDAMSKKLKI